ncbi:MAG: NYN domain-containing protein [Kiritimatiellae bacterium]|nr:NYN domain-containing protein [Kiritimatiellia bacterium]
MGLLDSIKSVFGGGASSGRGTDCVFIVDAEKLADSRDGRTGPVERFRAIQQLSRFADREKVEIIAILAGRPLREVANGDSFNSVRVFYVDENSSAADQIEKTLGSVSGRKAVVITNDKQLDARLNGRGVSTLRVSTLRKAFQKAATAIPTATEIVAVIVATAINDASAVAAPAPTVATVATVNVRRRLNRKRPPTPNSRRPRKPTMVPATRWTV